LIGIEKKKKKAIGIQDEHENAPIPEEEGHTGRQYVKRRIV
jgi:hypothetical protein